MYTDTKAIHAHVNGAYRAFAEAETLSDVAKQAGINPQLLRNKLCLDQPHQLTVSDALSITKATGNRCIVDGMLLELNCAVSMPLADYQDDEQTPLTDRALEITANAGKLSSIALDVKVTKRVNERMRHEVVNRVQRMMGELAIFAHEVETKFQAVPVLSIATDTLPMAGLY